MLKKIFLGLLLLVLASVFLCLVLDSLQAPRDQIVSYLLNQTSKEYFNQSIRVQGFRLDRNSQIYLEHFEGTLKTEEGLIPVEVSSIYSESALTDFFSSKGLLLNFREARPSHSLTKGVQGHCRIRGGKNGFMELEADVKSLNLQDLAGFQPEFLSGSQGELKGTVVFKIDSQKEPYFSANLDIEKPGGWLQSRFFDGVIPYLPLSSQKQLFKKLSDESKLVDFQDASLKVHLLQSDQIKVFLHILIPDYNLNLNLNMDIRIDEKNVLSQLFRIAGILKIKASS